MHTLVSFEAGSERAVLDRVARSLAGQLPPDRLDRLKTAVAEATLNAIEHGHGSRPDLTVAVDVLRRPGEIVVAVTDHGPAQPGRRQDSPEEPDLIRKLAGQQPRRGWGLFLIRHLVDAMDEVTRDGRHTVRLAVRAEES